MTAEAFADMMARPESGFDAMAPENVVPARGVARERRSRATSPDSVFEVSGGKISIADGWRLGPEVDTRRALGSRRGRPCRPRPPARAVPPQKVYGI